jgi:crotonobetainyl-CoA:carnitine CoA-transferase CaiB-like acyl-CoA transferase
MDYALNGRVAERMGNRSIYGFAPHGVFPCKGGDPAACEDRWIAIAIVDDRQWLALCRIMGRDDWASDGGLSTHADRAARQDELEASIAAWTADQDDYELFHRLQAAGIPSAPVLEGSRALDDPHAIARGLYQPQTMLDQVGTYRFPAPFYRFPETPITYRQPPVALGEHNEYVYREVLDVSDAEYARLRERGHISMEFDPSIP